MLLLARMNRSSAVFSAIVGFSTLAIVGFILSTNRAGDPQPAVAASEFTRSSMPQSFVPNSDSAPLDVSASVRGVNTAAADETAGFVGTWQQEKHGLRTLEVFSDGTAQMRVQPESTWAFVVGKHLQVDIDWKIEDGVLQASITGGKPANSVGIVKRLWGESWSRSIVTLSADKLIMRDESDQSLEEWQRVAEDAAKRTAQ